MPMDYLDDLNLKSCTFLSTHYEVSHETRTAKASATTTGKRGKDDCLVHYLIKKRDGGRSRDEKHWALSLRVLQSVSFNFSEQLL